jgi:hypothetical protein
MASEQQIAANRRNALRSSGPKTERGKRAAAINAVRHGLSAPLHLDEHRHSIEALVGLMVGECGGEAAPQDLAIKILDYERNEAQQRRQLQVWLQPQEPALQGDALVEATRRAMPEYDLLQDFVEAAAFSGERVAKQDGVQAARLQRQMERAILSEQSRANERVQRDASSALRYLRRSTNQLVKAIRALAPRP